jgi:RNA polymerase sigma factor (sigma-70 family)
MSSSTTGQQVNPIVVLPPSAKFLQEITAPERQLLERLLNEPQNYIPHESFDKKATEAELFAVDLELPRHKANLPTLKADQERLLFTRYNYACYRICITLEKFDGKRLSQKAATDLLQWGTQAQQTRADIIQFNVPLVLSMAKRSRLSGLDFNELVSEGNFALMRSVEKFDVSRGFKFSTYACRAILKSFSRVAMKVGRYRGLFPVELNVELERSDFAETKRMSVEEDCVDELKHILSSNLAELTDVERTVIRERFAIGTITDEGSKTLEQVGAIIGVTKERVRQIQNKALGKIRNTLEDGYLAA